LKGANDQRQDDEVCCELRRLQKLLKDKINQNNALRNKISGIVANLMPKEENERKQKMENTNLEKMYLKYMVCGIFNFILPNVSYLAKEEAEIESIVKVLKIERGILYVCMKCFPNCFFLPFDFQRLEAVCMIIQKKFENLLVL
jgi:hypothetical protein